MWILQIHLTDLAVGTPLRKAAACGFQMGAASGCRAVGKIKSRSKLVGEPLILDEAILASRLNGLFVQTHGIGVSSFKARDLGRHQCVLVAEGRWIVVGPLAQLFKVRRQEVAPLALLVGGSLLIACRNGQRGIL